MKKPLILAMTALSVAVVAACTIDDKMNTCVKQEESIESFIANHYADSTVYVTDTGISRIVMVHGNGSEAKKGDSVLFSYQGYNFKNGPSDQFAEGSFKAKLGSKDLVIGLDEGMVGMQPGEEAYIAFSARYGFYDESVGTVDPMTALIYYVTLEDILK